MKEIVLTDKLQQYFGFDRFKGQQEAAVRNVLEGKNTFVLMPTGGGKSLIYQLPALLLEGTAIIISPLIALMKNQVDSIRGMHAEDNVAHFLNSSLSKCCATPVLWILENNSAAQRFYEKNGFLLTGKRKKVTSGLEELEMTFTLS